MQPAAIVERCTQLSMWLVWSCKVLLGNCHFHLQSGQPQPDPGIAVTVGQDTLGDVEGITYSAAVQVIYSMVLVNKMQDTIVLDPVLVASL